MNRSRWLMCLIATAGFAVGRPAAADLAFHLDVDTHGELTAGSSGAAPADGHRALDATLSDRAIVLRSDKETTFYDFASRRRIVIDHATRQRVDYSLYDMVGLRVLELQNRIALGRALNAAKLDRNPMTAVDNEQDLGIQDQKSSPLRMTDDADGRTFADGPRVFYHQGAQATGVSPEQMRWFARFLRHVGSMHPQIVAAIEDGPGIPTDFVVTSYGALMQTTRYHVGAVRTVADAPYDVTPFALRPVAAGGDPIDRLLDRAALVGPADIERAKQVNAEALASARRDGRALDILLCTVERNLMTGEAAARFAPDELALLQADPVGTGVRGALVASTREQLAAAIDVFVAARASTTINAHVLKIFEANDRAKLGDTKTARALFIDVFAANPTIASAYKDFGDVLLMGYDTPRAWRSWDAGRRIGPGIANFSAVGQFERSLATRHPDFF